MEQNEALVTEFHMRSFLDRSINVCLSGGEIKRSELFQMLALMDAPDSGIDFESLELVGQMVQTLVTPDTDRSCSRAALLVTHTGYILHYVAVDQAHLLIEE